MTVRFPTKSSKDCRLVIVGLALFAGTSACGQIGPLYLPGQNGTATEQTEPQTKDDSSVEKKAREENDAENQGGL